MINHTHVWDNSEDGEFCCITCGKAHIDYLKGDEPR